VSCWFAHAIPWFTRPAPSSVAGISMPSALAVFRLMAGPMPLDASVGSIATKSAIQVTSAYPPTAEVQRTSLLVRFVPKHKVAALQPAAREQEPRDW